MSWLQMLCESAGGSKVGAYVGTVGKLGKEQVRTADKLGKEHVNGNGHGANVGAIVGPAGNGNGECNGDDLSNSTSNSNSTSFSDRYLPELVASKIHVHNNLSKTIITQLSDHEQMIETFKELRQRCSLQL